MASITSWSRIEPRPRNNSLARPLSAPVRDPFWFLTRQWQLGEFRGEDAGSPAYVQISARRSSLTGWQAGDQPVQPIPADHPLETLVENEPFTPDLAFAVELGQTFEALLFDAGGMAQRDAFRKQFPVSVPAKSDPETHRFAVVCAGRALDGMALFSAIQSAPATLPTAPFGVLDDFVKWVGEVFGEIGMTDPTTWDPQQIEYAVTLRGDLPAGGAGVFSAEPARDGGFEWHAFDLVSSAAANEPNAAIETIQKSVMPSHVRFRGMPNARWWDFENNVTDFGGIDVHRQDLAKLAVMDFLLLHGNDWFLAPLSLPLNSLCRIDLFLVRDVFGGLTQVERADKLGQVNGGAWTIFSTALADTPARVADFFLLPSTAATAVENGLTIEDVRFIRDPIANMAWAIEHQTEGGIGQPRLGAERDSEDRASAPQPVAPPAGADAPKLRYQIETDVPENWIPFIPAALNPGNNVGGEIVLKLGAMLPPSADRTPIPPVGRVLNSTNLPALPYTLREEEVPRTGVRVLRIIARSRWHDGSTHLWIARRKTSGLGEGSSALKFDLAAPQK
jgi:hypothetical protein